MVKRLAPLLVPLAADADLARIVQGWPTLPKNIRAAILALVDSQAK